MDYNTSRSKNVSKWTTLFHVSLRMSLKLTDYIHLTSTAYTSYNPCHRNTDFCDTLGTDYLSMGDSTDYFYILRGTVRATEYIVLRPRLKEAHNHRDTRTDRVNTVVFSWAENYWTTDACNKRCLKPGSDKWVGRSGNLATLATSSDWR